MSRFQDAAESSHNPEFVSRFIEDYEPIRRLGQGGFSIVLEARDKLVDIHYAVKRILLPYDAAEKERMMREVKAHARLSHQHIVRYYKTWKEAPPPGWQARTDRLLADKVGSSIDDPGWTVAEQSPLTPGAEYDQRWGKKYLGKPSSDSEQTDLVSDMAAASLDESSGGIYMYSEEPTSRACGRDDTISEENIISQEPPSEYLYIAMELCAGGTLKDWLEKTEVRERRICIKLFRQICTGVAYIHRQNLIHRDLKPANIYLSEDHCIKIGDFGLAVDPGKAGDGLEPGQPPVELSEMVGTRLYMSPEQLERRPYNHKVDIYSLALILLDLVSPGMDYRERLDVLREARRNVYPVMVEPEWTCMLDEMLNPLAEVRPDVKTILMYGPKTPQPR